MKTPTPRGTGAPEPSSHLHHTAEGAQAQPANLGHQGHQRGHGWMMIACCIPMLIRLF
jgi:hypothetical protein